MNFGVCHISRRIESAVRYALMTVQEEKFLLEPITEDSSDKDARNVIETK